MKIALTVKGAGLGAWLDDDFAHCEHVMIIDDDNRFDSWMNPYRGGDEAQPAKLIEAIVAEDIDVLITGQINSSISDTLEEAGIKIIVKDEGTVFDLVEEARNIL